MLNAALTGNIASGKSTVARLFAAWGATVIDADELVREVQSPGTPVLEAIRLRFGDDMIDSQGALDRDALRQRVLADPEDRADLEAIVHPAVARRRATLVHQARARGDSIVINDIPLLFEVLDPDDFDAVVLVDAPETDRRDRLVRHRGLPVAEAEALVAAQMPVEKKRPRSTFVIDNTGSLDDLRERALQAWRGLLDLTSDRR